MNASKCVRGVLFNVNSLLRFCWFERSKRKPFKYKFRRIKMQKLRRCDRWTFFETPNHDVHKRNQQQFFSLWKWLLMKFDACSIFCFIFLIQQSCKNCNKVYLKNTLQVIGAIQMYLICSHIWNDMFAVHIYACKQTDQSQGKT